MAVVTSTPLTLAYVIADIASVLATFNRLRWYRSRTGQGGLYEPATAAVVAPAVVRGSSSGPHALDGKTFSFKVGGVTTVNVPFVTPDPYTTAAVVILVNAATLLVVASAGPDDELVLTSVGTGSGASIEILESDAAPYLGFQVGDAAVGLDADQVLTLPVQQYFYADQNSSSEFFYRTQFVHSITLQQSELSTAFQPPNSQVIPYAQTSVGFIKLSDLSGRSIPGREITIANVFLPNTVAGYAVFRHYDRITTDQNGYAEIRLIKGAKVDISIGGTGFVRRIQVPATPDVFDMLDPSLVVADEFGIQEPKIDFAIRTT